VSAPSGSLRNPVNEALGSVIARRLERDGLMASWRHVVLIDFGADYGLPLGFVAAWQACRRAHDVLLATTSICSIAWLERHQSIRSVKAMNFAWKLSAFAHHRDGFASARIDRVGASEALAWLGVAHDYGDVRPRSKARMLCASLDGGWVALTYDDRGMQVAFRTNRRAAKFARSCRRAGLDARVLGCDDR